MENNRDIGYKAEKIASDFLESLGYSIIQKNFHFGKYGEIDIICDDNNTLVFVEVKYRNTSNYGTLKALLLKIKPSDELLRVFYIFEKFQIKNVDSM